MAEAQQFTQFLFRNKKISEPKSLRTKTTCQKNEQKLAPVFQLFEINFLKKEMSCASNPLIKNKTKKYKTEEMITKRNMFKKKKK